MITIVDPNSARRQTFNSLSDLQRLLATPGSSTSKLQSFRIFDATGADALPGFQTGKGSTATVSDYLKGMQQTGSSPTTPASTVPPATTPLPPPPAGGIPVPTPPPSAGGAGLTNPAVPNTPATPGSTPVATATVPNTDISPYIPSTSQQQQDIINNAITQSQGVANQNVQSLKDILNPYVVEQFGAWTNPNSPDYQATAGSLNNMGRYDENTFGQSLASRLAPLISQNQKDLGTGALLPSFLTQQGLVNSGAGIQSGLGLSSLQRFIDQQNFGQQATLANQLADKGVPSNFQQAAGTTSSILGGLGNLFQGLPGLKQVANGTWICTHLKNMGLATLEEVEHVHTQLRPTIFTHILKWIHYVVFAPRLIKVADEAGVDWQEVKRVLVDSVLAEPDSEKAFQIYFTECQRLALKYAPELAWRNDFELAF